MRIIEQSEISDLQKARVVEMWNAEYPASIAYADVSGFDEYLNERGDKKHFLMIDEAEKIVGWAMIFDRENARWFAIIIDGKIQGRGFGVKLIDALKASENRLFGWVIDNDESLKTNGEKYKSPLGFYRKIGFRVHDRERIEKQNISGVKIEWNAEKSAQ